MSLKSFTSLLALLLVSALPQASFAQTDDDELTIETDEEKMSYCLGVQFGRALEYSRDRIDLEVLIRAMMDAMSGADLAMSDAELFNAIREFSLLARKDREDALTFEGQAYLEAKAKEEGVVVLPSGLQYKIIREGTGVSPGPTDTFEAHYRGTLVDGSEFDSSYKRDTPLKSSVNGMIAGWIEALQLMKVGAKWELYVPHNLAYGPGGRKGIPPYSTLVFELELLRIVE